MLDHLGIKTDQYPESKAFYTALFETLGYVPLQEFTAEMNVGYVGTGFGKPDGAPTFWVGVGKPPESELHIAFTAANHAEVDAFHAKALALGAKDNGAPGLRPHYHPHYYGAFVIDLNGHNIEAVCHQPQP